MYERNCVVLLRDIVDGILGERLIMLEWSVFTLLHDWGRHVFIYKMLVRCSSRQMLAWFTEAFESDVL